MREEFIRTALIMGEDAVEKLNNSRIAVFGVGGVGGFAVEALARSGVGTLDLIDNDTVALSNLNRQIIALHSTLGEYKADAAKKRILDINPEAKVNCFKVFYMPETADQFDFTKYDYIIDAIDTVTGKLTIAQNAHKAGVPLISSMGAGNKLDPTAFKVADISKTSVCPLAKVMRRELKKRGIDHLKVVYSEEPPLTPAGSGAEKDSHRRSTPGSTAFVPSVAGLIIAGEVIKDLTGGKR